jgi:ParB family chromosome partitioning protein
MKSSSQTQLSVPLSYLVPSRRNPRKVRPSRQSHESLVALIRSLGLLQPLVVRPAEGKPKHYEVVAGGRRLRALREIHKDDGDPKVPCILFDVDEATVDAVALGENFGREAMHPLDESDAFSKLAADEAKGVDDVAATFGVSAKYVKQRLALASLAGVVKSAFRSGEIGIATAEAFASVPAAKQIEVWKELNGHPRHAEHVRNVIANGWIDATQALFDVSSLPDSAVSRDLFSEQVLVERTAFMAAQAEALLKERQSMIEAGWGDVVAGKFGDVEQPVGMDIPRREFDPETAAKLEKIAARRQKLESKLEAIKVDDNEGVAAVQDKFSALESEEQEIIEHAPPYVSEATKAVATAYLILSPDGQVQRGYRVPRRRGQENGNGRTHSPDGSDGGTDGGDQVSPPTSDDLGGNQLAVTFTHQALAVREAVLNNPSVRKRLMAMILHDKVRSEALAVRHEPNGTTLHAGAEGFISPVADRLRAKRSKLDPFADQFYIEDRQAYRGLGELSGAKLDALIEILTIECITAHLQRRTELIHILAGELKVNVRDGWKPDAAWLSGFKKIQLGHLLVELKGPAYTPSPDAKKTELVESLAALFSTAAEGKLEDKRLAERVNSWLPVNLREAAPEPISRKEK